MLSENENWSKNWNENENELYFIACLRCIFNSSRNYEIYVTLLKGTTTSSCHVCNKQRSWQAFIHFYTPTNLIKLDKPFIIAFSMNINESVIINNNNNQ